MRNLKFRFARAENILCFGSAGIELHFSDYGNVIQVRGINLDNPGTSDDPASNASGKSSLQEILSIGLFGRTVKSPTKVTMGQVLNVSADKGEIEVQWDNYRILRTFRRDKNGSVSGKIRAWESPNHIWDDSSEVTKGGRPGVNQEWIDSRLGMNHHTFCNVAIFDDSSLYAFLEASGPVKRQFVENLLSLDQHCRYHTNAKSLVKKLKDAIDVMGREYSLLKNDVEACERRLQILHQQETHWRQTKQNELQELLTRIKTKQTQLEKSDSGEQLINWQKGQERISALTEEIADLEAKAAKAKILIANAKERLESVKEHRDAVSGVAHSHSLALAKAHSELNEHIRLINQLEGLQDGAKCPVCHSTIKKENYSSVLRHAKHSVDDCKQVIRQEETSVDTYKAEFGTKSESASLMEKKISEAEGKVALLENKMRQCRSEINQLSVIRRPEGNVQEEVLEAEIVELKKQAKLKTDELSGASPYTEISAEAQKELTEKKAKTDKKSADIAAAEKELPYYQYWVEAFGDRGIRRYVVDDIIPALNTRIAYWLTYLIDGRMELTFDNELEETITRNQNPAFYYLMSAGEKRRVNLAISQAFAYVMMLNSGCCPSLVFLDEITGGSIDRAGVVGIYNMIFELAKERQVFVTTHNENLISMLQGCETVTLKKQNDVTILVS